MAKGESGRIVIEVDPVLKRELYEALQREGLTLKGWFLQRANKYVANQVQPGLALMNSDDERAGR